MAYYPVRFRHQATIANGATDSDAIQLEDESLVGIFIPSSFTGTSLSFKTTSGPSGTYVPITNEDGTTYEVTVAASTYVIVDLQIFAGIRFLKVVSGSAEGGARTLTLATRAV